MQLPARSQYVIGIVLFSKYVLEVLPVIQLAFQNPFVDELIVVSSQPIDVRLYVTLAIPLPLSETFIEIEKL